MNYKAYFRDIYAYYRDLNLIFSINITWFRKNPYFIGSMKKIHKFASNKVLDLSTMFDKIQP